ncbi:prealbumin-like fold domain-containing protein [Montanilutibacter psychrotolerans]|uniref:DUF11 domain-containing protein n=1 Tax=Montanilutibacter psychrotolerans TaxID=1327343 RepID=A0A3M8T127_9GAMM|nr:SdrD B-like domain-containing protein [Lysobacter psychrotolerans]RNF85234.1 hypothetical protein EER27_05540 [Lysobacter psychrotolerans]
MIKTLLRLLSWTPASTYARRWPQVLPCLALLILLASCGTAHAATVSGTVFEDTDGDLLGGGPGIVGQTVRLYNSAGTLAQTTTTVAGGSYSFLAVADGVYYVAADAPTVTAGGTVGVLSEQTFAGAGTGNGGAIGTNYGPLCVMGTPPTYTDQGGTTTTNTPVNNSATSACYGGRRGSVADSGSAVLNTKEHVTRINVASNNDVAIVDFGFSFNVLTNVNDAGQGSLRQFLTNANAIAGANVMRFVPAVATNATSGGSWWRIALASNLAPIAAGNGDGTRIEGTAYSKVDGSTVLDTNAGDLRPATVVGYLADQATIPALARPELQIDRAATSTASFVMPVIHVQAANVAVRSVSITFGTESILVNTTGVTGLLVEDSALGVTPALAPAMPSTWNGGSDAGANIIVTSAANCTAVGSAGTVRHNVLMSANANVRLCGNATSYAINFNFSLAAVGHPLGTTGIGLAFWGSLSALPTTCSSNNTLVNNHTASMRLVTAMCGSNSQVIGNTAISGNGSSIDANTATRLLVRGNVVTNYSFGSPVLVRNAAVGQQVEITQNSFANNPANGIDLNGNGVTTVTATGGNCPSSGVTNGGIPRPRITSNQLSGTTLTVSGNYCNTGTYRIEFFKVAAGSAGDIGADTLQAGEGQFYLGALTGQTGGTFTNSAVTIPAATLAIGDSITAVAIREDGATTAGNSSEFSANALVGVAVSGTVFQDTVGDLLADGAVGSAGNPAIAARTVRLFNSAGTELQTATTAADGTYAFNGVVNGVYYVAVDAPIVDAGGTAGVLGEQTYAVAGTGNGGTAGTNYGSLCVMGTPPTYTDQGATTTTNTPVNNSANGACYGGRRGSVADSGTTTINTKEHVVRINVLDSSVTSVDFGFSFNVVTSINDAGQGALRQFMINGNAIAGANVMRFVPTVMPNAGAATWWRVALASNLPAITAGNGAGTRIEGVAYSKADGSTVLDTNSGDLQPATSVGYLTDQATIPAIARPELQIDRAVVSNAGFGWALPVIHVQAADVAVRNVSITFGSESVLVNSNGVTNLLLENNALGLTPNGAQAWPSTWNGGSDSGNNVSVTNTNSGNCSALSSTGTIRSNVIASPGPSIRLCGNGVAYTISSNIARIITGHPTGTKGQALVLWGSNLSAPATCVSNSTLLNNMAETRALAFASCGSNNVIVGNTVNTAAGGDLLAAVMATDATGLLIRGNVLANMNSGAAPPNAGAGVQVRQANAGGGLRVQITQNSFFANAANAIDLNNNGVTTTTATGGNCPSSGLANGGLPRPRITSSSLAGTTLTASGNYCNTGTYRLEFYKVAAGNAGDVGADTLQAGEGQIYLGALTGQTGGAFTNSAITIPASTLANGDSITAIAIREDGAATAGNTSEFSANALLGATVSGTVFQDSVGDLLADGAVANAGNPALAGRTVRLFNSAGTQLQTATTAADGTYSFGSVVNGVYYVAVDAPITDAIGTAGVLGEQTYASAGTGNGGTAGTDYGSLCVMGTPPTYTDQGATTITNTPVDNSATGACYGGRRGSVADSGTTTINTKEHVVRINVLDSSVTSADFGFSFNVLSNVNDAGQGSARQFVVNANAIAGANALRFVPAIATNAVGGGGTWWRVALASNLPALTLGNGNGTTIDGMAYSRVDGSTVLDTNAGNLTSAQTVGVGSDQATISPVARPELQWERNATGAMTTVPVLHVQAANTSIRRVSVTRGTESVLVTTSNVSNLLVEDSALGVAPDGSSAPPTDTGSSGTAIRVGFTGVNICPGLTNSTGTIQRNVLGSIAGNVNFCGLALASGSSYTVSSNFFSVSGTTAAGWGSAAALGPSLSASNITFINNHVQGRNAGVMPYSGSNNRVIGNFIGGSIGNGLTSRDATGLLVRGNQFTGGGTAAVFLLAASGATGQQVQVTQNSFSANGGNAIDLNWNGVTTTTATGGNCPSSGLHNGGLPRPRITSATLAGTTLTVSGNYCNAGTYRIEFYKVAAGNAGDVGADTLQAGEGETYLGALTGQTGGAVTNGSFTVSGSLAIGNSITAIAIREDGATTVGNTSEFSANTVVTLQFPRITLTKLSIGAVGTFVFNGEAANANGFPTNSSYSLTTTAPNTPVAGTQVTLAAANVLTDIKETLPAGWVLSAVTCTDANAAGSGNPTGTLTPQIVNGNTIRIAAENAKLGADLRCTVTNTQAGFSLSGLVILDDGAGGGTAHDAIQNGAETGRGSVTLSLTNCGPTTYSTATTDAGGTFSLSLSGVPAGPVCLVKTPTAGFLPVSANIGNAAGGVYTRTTDTLAFTLAANTNYSSIILGEVTQSRLTTDGAQQVPDGGNVTYAHTFVAGTSAQVAFSTSDAPTPAVPGWASLLYRDANCDALLDAGDSPVTSPVAVTAGQTVCLLNRVTSPAGATDGMSNVTTVTASEALTLITLIVPHTRTDTTTVGKAGLTLIKQVRKVTVCPATAAASQLDATVWTTSNTALPGQLLEYRIIYRNDTPAPVTQVKVHDTVPAYTQFKSALCLDTPVTGLSGCTVTSAPAVNATSGAVEWTVADAAGPVAGLQPGATGNVGYCQQVMP